MSKCPASVPLRHIVPPLPLLVIILSFPTRYMYIGCCAVPCPTPVLSDHHVPPSYTALFDIYLTAVLPRQVWSKPRKIDLWIDRER